MHMFEKELGENQAPVGWYTILVKEDGDILLHEYQSDVIPETIQGLKDIAKLKGTEEINIKADEGPSSIIDSFILGGELICYR